MSSAFAAVHAHMRRQEERRVTASEIEFVDIVVYATITFIVFMAGVRWCRRHPSSSPPVTEPLGAILFVPALLDAIFGGNRRERLLYPHRFTHEPAAARASHS